MDNQLHACHHSINKRVRCQYLKQKPFLLWFTGLSNSGKSTLAHKVEAKLVEKGYYTYLLDGDNIRIGLNKDLGFDKMDRTENIRRVGEVCNLFLDAGLIILSAFISPYQKDRKNVRALVEKKEFIEIFVDVPLSICEKRDSKGMYKKVRKGTLKNFTGIDSVYEEPFNPEIHIKNYNISTDESTNIVINYLQEKGYII